MKKILALILALTLAVSLCACGGADKVTPTEESIEWKCENCGKQNNGEFCADCGHPVPKWTCEECGTENIGRFCTKCGAMNKLRVANDLAIATAQEAFENLDVVGALSLLDTAQNLTDAQQKEADALRAIILNSCYEGTHFLKFEYVENLTVNGSKLIGTIQKGGYTYQCSAYGKKTEGSDLAYYSYDMIGKGDFGFAPANDYTAYLQNCYGNCVSKFMEERKDLWFAWALNRENKEYPSNMYIDDLGNMLVWVNGVRSSTNWFLDLSIRLAD